MNTLERIMLEAHKAAQNNESFDTYTVTMDEYAELLKEVGNRYDPKPQPPIKASLESWLTRQVEYDNQDPDYKISLAAWRVRNTNLGLGMQHLTINLPSGPCKILVGYNEA